MEVTKMITYWQIVKNGLLPLQAYAKGCVVNVVAPSTEEVNVLKNTFKISEDFLTDIMDIDERSRMETEEDKLYIIYRVPFYSPDQGVPYSTIPLGIILSDEAFIVICQNNNDVLMDVFARYTRKNTNFQSKTEFLFHIIESSTITFHKYLKQINLQTNLIEKELERSTKNRELHKLLLMEKCLVYFSTSLRSNEILITKLKNSRHFKGEMETEELMEDAIIELKQAIEMTNIYSNILTGMMDAFASVISNNLNIVMKQLTTITIILMIPTLISSMFGMNVPNGMEKNPVAFYGILGVSVVFSIIGVLLLRRKRWV
jgi:magnesium transporter